MKYERPDISGDASPEPRLVPIERNETNIKYHVVTREYMADGHDGFEALVGRARIIDEEAGQLFSTIIRRYLLGRRRTNHGCTCSYLLSFKVHSICKQ